MAIVALAAFLRLVNLPARGEWGGDQGTQLLDVWNDLQARALPQVGPLAISVGTFHHGAAPYDFWLPVLWLGRGDPLFVVGETAALGTLVVPLVWWVARSIAGPAAGLITAYLAAISAALIGYSIFVWNPTLLEPGAALAVLGAWQAWRSRNPRWWLVAAVGFDVVIQSHIAGPLLGLPFAAVYVLSIRRAGSDRIRHLRWGLVAAGFIAVTYLPFVAYELGSDFADVRGLVAFFTTPSQTQGLAPPLALFVVFVRILAWPLTGWPGERRDEGFSLALLASFGVAASLIWQIRRLSGARRRAPEEAPEANTDTNADADGDPERDRREGLWFVAGSLAVLMVAGALTLKNMSLVQRLPTEQYHAWADPLALIAAGLALGVLVRVPGPLRAPRLPQAMLIAILAILTAWNGLCWPPLVAEDGGYPKAQAAARAVEKHLDGQPVAIVSLFPPLNPNGYVYPLVLDGVHPVEADQAAILVLYCDSFFTEGCRGQAEQTWLAQNVTTTPQLVDRIDGGTGRTLSVYRVTRP